MSTTAVASSWGTIALRDCCDIVAGSTPSREVAQFWDGPIPWATPKDLSDLDSPVLENTPEGITQAGFDSCSTQMLPKGAVLFSSRAPIGLVAIAGRPMCTNQGFKSFVPGPGVDSLYLYYCLKSMVPQIQARGNGATFKEVSKEVIGSFEIPIPFPDDPRRSLTEQKRIAAILDKADAIRRRRQEAARFADTLIPSVFYEIFGDPASNPKRLPVATIGELAPVLTGATPSRLVANYYGGSIPWVKTTEVTNGVIRTTEETLTEQGMESSRCELYPIGSLVIALYGQGATRGRTAMLAIEAAANQACAIIPPTPTYVTSFLWTQLRMSYERLRGEARGGNQPNLNLQIVRSFTVLNPPLERQKAFDRHFQRHTALLATQTASQEKADNMFNALVQRAFRGEL